MANHEHVAKLKEGVEAWNKWRKENPLVKPDLAESDLRGTSLKGANLDEANLKRAILEGTDLRGTRLSKANLSEALLPNANLRGVIMKGVFREGANLFKADLSGANLEGANLFKAYLAEANLKGANLFKADLERANLANSVLEKSDLRNAKLEKAILKQANLTEANLEGADLRRAILDGAVLSKANLKGAILEVHDFNVLISALKNYFILTPEMSLKPTTESISRSIEFRPEHTEAGISILSYFGTVVRRKYPDGGVKVRIEQDGLKVTMITETPEGLREAVEKTLDEYGLVVVGKMTIEEFCSDATEILELKQQLRFAHFQLEQKTELLEYFKDDRSGRIQNLENEVMFLRGVVGAGLREIPCKVLDVAGLSIEAVVSTTKTWSDLVTFLLQDHKNIQQELFQLGEKLTNQNPNQSDIEEVKDLLKAIKSKEPTAFEQCVAYAEKFTTGVAGSVWASVILETAKQFV